MNPPNSGEPDAEKPRREKGDAAQVGNTFTGTAHVVLQGSVKGDVNIAGPADPVDLAARRLAGEVRERWAGEARRRAVWRPVPVPVRWSSTLRPVQAARYEELRLTGDVNGLAAAFRELPDRQLVVLGEPGAGKTVLAMLLVLGLLDDPRPGEPVPVLLTLSSWRPGMPLRRWLARRLAEDHPFLDEDGMAARLVGEGRVLPVLDGLDEMSPALHASAIEAIDLGLAGRAPLVVTCRTTEYESAVGPTGSRLSRAAVVEIEELDVPRCVGFLREGLVSGDDRWEPVFEHLHAHPDGAAAGALSTPLMLFLARTIYTDPASDPSDLLGFEREALETHLLDSFVPAVYAVHHDGTYEAGKAQRWLSHIAGRMKRRGAQEIGWWQLRSPAAALAVALIFGSGGWWIFSLILGPVAGALGGLIVGGTAGLSCIPDLYKWPEVAADDSAATGPRSLLRRSRGRAGLWTILAGLGAGVLLGLWFGVTVGASARNTVTYSAVLAVMFGFGTLIGTAWGSFLVSRWWLAATGRLPRRLMDFIDDAHERGVLRKSGTVYQFRHVRLQESLSRDRRAAVLVENAPSSPPPGLLRIFTFVPLLRLLVQALGVLGTYGLITAVSGVSLAFASGDEPEREIKTAPCGAGACSVSEVTYFWRLPPRAVRSAGYRLDGKSVDLPYTGLGGAFGVRGCSGGRVRVEAAIDRVRLDPFVVGRAGTRSAPKLRPQRRARPRTVTLVLRRLDSRPCTAELTWRQPRLTHAHLFNIKNRLG